MFIVWLGDMITKRGIGNGISLIIFAGIVARLPSALAELFSLVSSDQINAVVVLVVFAMFVLVVAMVVLEQQGQRKIRCITKARRGKEDVRGQNSYIPFRSTHPGSSRSSSPLRC
jgi:preprotein translocase subunit SecY